MNFEDKIKNCTQVKDQNNKLDIIDHLNDDHEQEVLWVAQVFLNDELIQNAMIKEIYEEGMHINIQNDKNENKDIFIPFLCDGEIEEKVLFLSYKAMTKKGYIMPGTKDRYFNVIKTEKLTTNMTRIIISSDFPFPEDNPGYAYLFSLKILKGNKEYKDKEVTKMSLFTKWYFAILLMILKRLKSKNRERILSAMFQGLRYYTLRSSEVKSTENKILNIGYIDVFTHGESPGSAWCNALIPGDIIRSTSEISEKKDHLHIGHALLLADEAAMPALAGILEKWNNVIPPTIIILSTDQAEQSYIADNIIPKDSKVHRIITPQKEQLIAVLNVLKTIEKINVAWGVCESEDAKAIRKHLREHYHLEGKNNRVKGYWQLKDTPKKA